MAEEMLVTILTTLLFENLCICNNVHNLWWMMQNHTILKSAKENKYNAKRKKYI